MNKLCCLIIMLIVCRICDAQNLVPNPSFEDTVSCPNGLNGISDAEFWFSSTSGTPDYFNSCYDSILPWVSSVDVPVNFVGVQNAKTGSAYVGLLPYIYNPNAREYIEARLVSPLIQGLTYYVSFYLSRADSCIWAVDNIGAFLSNDTIIGTGWDPLTDVPQISNGQGNFLTDRLNWTKISGSYIAQGGEQYITIGNFNDDANTDTISVPGGNPSFQGFRYSYYYIDDICVSTDSLTCNSSVGINEAMNQEELVLFPNPFTNKLTITTKTNEQLQVTLYDITSRKLLQQSFTTSTSINTEQLSKGIYLYEVKNKNGIIRQGKIVKD